MAPLFLLKTSKQNSIALFGLIVLYFLIESPIDEEGTIITSLACALGVNTETIVKRRIIAKRKINFESFVAL